MDATCLLTFLLRGPSEAKTVELLGSWDGFFSPYRMHHDRLRGSNAWSGCFKFENIIFDGDELQRAKPRTGGLKQGGTYWYYYRINYDEDTYDDRQPRTTTCPLLPGQVVNVIEVPTELVELPSRCHSAHGYDIVGNLTSFAERKTLDPADKYATIEPPPMSKVHSRCLSDDQLDGRLEGQPRIVVDRAVSPVSAPCSRKSSTRCGASRRTSSRKSAISSFYSGYSAAGVPPTAESAVQATSGSIAQQTPSRKVIDDDELQHSFEYPDLLGTAPLGSLEALGAVLFATSSSRCPPEDAGRLHEAEICHVDDHRRDSTFSCGPASVQNVQFYGSRPGTSLGQDIDTYQPRTYSLPTSNISDGSPASSPSWAANFSALPNHEYLDCVPEDLYSRGPEEREPGPAELVSPTFTATTVSTGGNNTPSRLSDQFSNEEGRDSAADNDPRVSTSTESSVSSRRPSLLERSLARFRPSFNMNYSLPSLSSDSAHSLVKSVTRHSRRASQQGGAAQQLPLLPLSYEQEEEEVSMADAIFSELGFLSSSIT